jgi:predicted metalloendopeptidase
MLLAAACVVDQGGSYSDPGAASALSSEEISSGVLAAMDTSADPCEDFYRYACGGWLDVTELPGDESRWSRSFSEINIRNRQVLREVLEEFAERGSDDAELAKLGHYYASCMDEEAVEAAGTAPLEPWLERISRVEDAASLMDVAAAMYAEVGPVLFSADVFGDLKNPDTNIANFFQGGLGLPDRDYYLEEDKKKELEQYHAHVARMFELLGASAEQAVADTAAVVSFETALARASRTRTEMRDVERLYHKLDVKGLKELTPSLPWDRFFAGIGYPDIDDLNVGTPEFFEGLETLVGKSSPETLQAYLRWHLVHATANRLPAAFVEENFDFYSAKLQGQAEMRPRWRRCVNATDGALGELLGRAFVERQFPGDSKKIALEMIEQIEIAFQQGLPSLAWMDETTRERAVVKMKAILNKIGYPDEWRDYGALEVDPDDYFGNALRAGHFEFKRVADKAGKPVDPTEWQMTPPMVNAYYNPLINEMVFPAGILQQPFFHRDFPPAMNYGGIGMVMGHELTHGFDDMGRKFDPDGKMEQWWEDEAIESFNERTECVDELYSGYEVQPDLFVNGKLTMGENIADLGGLKEAHSAFRLHTEEYGESESIVDGLTNEQVFFVSFAQTWCMKSTPEMEKLLVNVDSHSPARFRVIGPTSNLPAFAEAFGCTEATAMNPAERCEVW